ncbi:MAG: hypothetical protein ACKOCX_04010 [Planctomycetota bacterium]
MSDPGRTSAVIGLFLVVLAVAVAVALAAPGQDPARWQAVALAATTTGAGALGGWLVSRWSRGQPAGTAVAGGLGATFVRTTPPLVALAWVTTSGGALLRAGAAGLIVAFYLALLATQLFVTIIEARKPRSRRGSDAAI